MTFVVEASPTHLNTTEYGVRELNTPEARAYFQDKFLAQEYADYLNGKIVDTSMESIKAAHNYGFHSAYTVRKTFDTLAYEKLRDWSCRDYLDSLDKTASAG